MKKRRRAAPAIWLVCIGVAAAAVAEPTARPASRPAAASTPEQRTIHHWAAAPWERRQAAEGLVPAERRVTYALRGPPATFTVTRVRPWLPDPRRRFIPRYHVRLWWPGEILEAVEPSELLWPYTDGQLPSPFRPPSRSLAINSFRPPATEATAPEGLAALRRLRRRGIRRGQTLYTYGPGFRPVIYVMGSPEAPRLRYHSDTGMMLVGMVVWHAGRIVRFVRLWWPEELLAIAEPAEILRPYFAGELRIPDPSPRRRLHLRWSDDPAEARSAPDPPVCLTIAATLANNSVRTHVTLEPRTRITDPTLLVIKVYKIGARVYLLRLCQDRGLPRADPWAPLHIRFWSRQPYPPLDERSIGLADVPFVDPERLWYLILGVPPLRLDYAPAPQDSHRLSVDGFGPLYSVPWVPTP
jgi:hypothetical protein